jgi:hypothetical protein
MRDAQGRWCAAKKAAPSEDEKATPSTKRTTAESAGTAQNEGTKSRAVVVKRILRNMEAKLRGRNVKASLADYIRLVQLQKELDEDAPREIKVTWVGTGTETKRQANPDETSGNDE